MTDSGRLLIVDDETPVLEVLSEYFSGQGYDVETASSGKQALESVGRRRPDVVLLDIRMAGMDGVETLRRLRDLETLKIGAFDYVAKPFDFKYLDQAVAAGVMVAATASRETPAPPPPAENEDPLTALAVVVFRAARAMPDAARLSMGRRLEDAVLAAGRECAAGRPAAEPLAELDRLIALAVALGDLNGLTRDGIATAIAAVRRTLPGR
jgi:CheY-like chemotaxis protein